MAEKSKLMNAMSDLEGRLEQAQRQIEELQGKTQVDQEFERVYEKARKSQNQSLKKSHPPSGRDSGMRTLGKKRAF